MTASPLLSPPHRRVTWLDLLAVAVVTFAVFLPVYRTWFAPLDDTLMISDNTNVTEPTWEHFKSFWTETSFRIYMPLTLSIWQGVAAFSHAGSSADNSYVVLPAGFKLVSMLTHAASATAAVWTLSMLTGTRWAAVLGGLIFALHPIQVESVAWTTGLKDELCGLFSTLAIGFYAVHVRRDPESPWADWRWWLSLAAAMLAMSSKPTAMLLPLMLVVVDWAIQRRTVVRRFVSIGPFLLPAIGCVLIILSAQGNSIVPNIKPSLRPLVATDAYAFYFGKVLWPVNLSVDYGRRPHSVLESGTIWWTWIFPLSALIGVALLRSRRWWLAAVFFIVPIIPVSGLATFDMQQYSTVTDHYMYQPMLGVALAVTLLALIWPRPAFVIGVFMCCLFAVMSWRTATLWQNSEAYYDRMLALNPKSWLARNMLGASASLRGDLFTTKRMIEEGYQYSQYSGTVIDNHSVYELMMGRNRSAAELGLKAIENVTMPRIELARRITLLGWKLNDRDITEKGVRYWLKLKPDSDVARGMLKAIIQSKADDARRTKSTQPTTRSWLSIGLLEFMLAKVVAIPASVLADIIADGVHRRPREACGLLAGEWAGERVVVHDVAALANVWPIEAEQTRRFAIDPLEQLRAEAKLSAAGRDIVGFYHSHPHSAPVPSAFDLERAWPKYVYLIVGYENEEEPLPRAWSLDDSGAFVEHRLEIHE